MMIKQKLPSQHHFFPSQPALYAQHTALHHPRAPSPTLDPPFLFSLF